MKNKKIEYQIAGAVEFISEYEAMKAGYPYEVDTSPVLIYSENGTLDEKLFIKEQGFHTEDKYHYVPDLIITSKMKLDKAREEYPELFL